MSYKCKIWLLYWKCLPFVFPFSEYYIFILLEVLLLVYKVSLCLHFGPDLLSENDRCPYSLDFTTQ